MLGSSAAFGVGATGDSRTVPSFLAGTTGISFLNLGIRSGNSLQEVEASLAFIDHAGVVVVLSGFNVLLSCMQSLGEFDLFAPLFQEETLLKMRDYSLRDFKRFFKKRRMPHPGRHVVATGDTGIQQPRAGVSSAQRPDTKSQVENALSVFRRDIGHLAQPCRGPRRLVMAIQPFAPIAKPEISPEEEELFALSPGAESSSYDATMARLRETWPAYVTALMGICRELGVCVIDLNALEYPGWCFVDLVHMTDRGYEVAAKAIDSQLKGMA